MSTATIAPDSAHLIGLDETDDVYHRQSLIRQNGRVWSQAGIEQAPVLLVGAGNIGGAAGVALTQTGFRHVDVVDHDVLTTANLSRGLVYRAADVGRPKAIVLAERLRELDPRSQARGIVADVRYGFGTARFGEYDLVLLATHDMSSRRHVNLYVHLWPGRARAIVEGGIDDLTFAVQTIVPGQSACYACFLPLDMTDPEAYQSCTGVVTSRTVPPAATNGLDGMAVAALMAKEAALMAAGLDPFFVGRELRFEAATGQTRLLLKDRNQECQEHQQAGDREVVSIPFGPETSVGDVQAGVAGSLGLPADRVSIFSPLMITTRLICDCGEAIPVMQPQKAPLQPACPACGAADPTHFRAERLRDLTSGGAERTLGEYGIPSRQILEAYVCHDRYFVIPRTDERGGRDVLP